MKTGFFSSLLAVSALQLAAARPHGRAQERDVVIKYVTATQPAAIVYVNQDGVPYATSTIGQTVVQATDAPAPAAGVVHVHTLHVPKPAATAAAAPAAAAPATGAATGAKSKLHGITYSPYNADGTCKSQSQVDTDFEQLNDYSMVRIYGVDCDQVTTVGNAAKAKGMKLYAGIYDINNVNAEVQTLVTAVGGDWSHIDTVSIGNEVVNSGAGSVPQVLSALGVARPLLSAAGYTGPVVTTDTFIAIINNPELCQASDYAAANCHAFFAGVPASQAGSYVLQQYYLVKQACGGKETRITESGWPSSGATNMQSVPSVADQQTALSSLSSTFSGKQVTLYTAYNDLWKTNNAYTFAAEQFWGIYGTSSA